MALSNELLTQFAKTINNTKKEEPPKSLYGTVVTYNGKQYVKLDGSELLTPVKTTTDIGDGDRVSVEIKDHTGVITGNISSPSAKNDTVIQMGNKITEAEILIADKVSTKEFDAQVGRIDELVSTDVIIKNQLTAHKADIDSLVAKDVTIENSLTANKAEIDTLKVNKLDASAAELKFATINSLEATNATIHNLSGDYASFKSTTTDKLTANDASIKNLETEKLSAKDAELKYANIDFANINEAAVKKLFTDSGIIKDLIVSQGHITGELVGVTIKGDLIQAGTVKADKLVVKGSDGIYYKLNMTAEKVEALQTNQNSLDGSVITAKSITATKVMVDDLVAFGATIGGFQLTNNSIYSGVKNDIDNTSRGIYMDKEGQLAIGDASNFLRYFKDNKTGQYKLEISAGSISMGTSGSDLETTLGDTITSSVEEFYQSTSSTELIGGSWSSIPCTWVDGKYIWRRTIVTHGNGTIEYTPSQNGICITGNTGSKGDDAVTLQIFSSNGTLFKNTSLATTLTVTIIVGGEMITSSAEMYAKFGQQATIEWEQKRFGETVFTKISPVDSRLSDNGFILTLTTTDVYTHTVFNCGLTY